MITSSLHVIGRTCVWSRQDYLEVIVRVVTVGVRPGRHPQSILPHINILHSIKYSIKYRIDTYIVKALTLYSIKYSIKYRIDPYIINILT